MTLFDFIAFFFYTLVFAFLFSLSRKKIESEKLKAYHRNAFWVKVFASFCYSMFVLYISPGDTTTLYFPEGYNLYKLVLHDPSNLHLLFEPGKNINANILAHPRQIGYFTDPGNFMVIRVTAFLCFLTFGKYLVINLVFAMIAFSGIWRLYRFFYEQFPQLHKQFAIAILFLPTFTFWSSGILKEPLVISALGWLTYSLYKLAYEKKKLIKNTLRVSLAIYIFSAIKIYILLAYLPAFVVFLLLKNAMLVKSAFFKVLLAVIFFGASIFIFIREGDNMIESLGKFGSQDLTENISMRQENFQDQGKKSDGSFFTLNVAFDGTLQGFIKLAPAALVATLFRPFIWESRNVSTLLSSLESLAIMLFTLFVLIKVGIRKFITSIITRPIILYCFSFSVVFAVFVGASTLNFGTLVRYKIPAMPFYVISLMLIFFYNKKKNENAEKEQRLAVSVY